MTAKKIQYARLEKLAQHLKTGKLGHKRFDFNEVNDDYANYPVAKTVKPVVPGCGTAGCAMGECPIVFKRHWKFRRPDILCSTPVLRKNSTNYLRSDIASFFGISEAAVLHLFFPEQQITGMYGGKNLSINASRKQVASNILAFVERAKAGKIYDEPTDV